MKTINYTHTPTTTERVLDELGKIALGGLTTHRRLEAIKLYLEYAGLDFESEIVEQLKQIEALDKEAVRSLREIAHKMATGPAKQKTIYSKSYTQDEYNQILKEMETIPTSI